MNDEEKAAASKLLNEGNPSGYLALMQAVEIRVGLDLATAKTAAYRDKQTKKDQ